MAIDNLNAHPTQCAAQYKGYSVFLLSDGNVRFAKEGGNAIDVAQDSSTVREFTTIKSLDEFVEFMENTLSIYEISEI